MAFETGIHYFLGCVAPEEPLSFCTTTCLMSLTFVATGSQTLVCFSFCSVTVLVTPEGTVWTSVSAGGRRLEAGQPWKTETMGISQHLPRAFLGEFPCTPIQGVSHQKHLDGERKQVWGGDRL